MAGDEIVGHPEVFAKPPEQTNTELKPGQLTEREIEQLFSEGFLVLEKFFNVEELKPCLAAIERMVDNLAQKLFKSGRIKNLHEDLGVYYRLAALEKEFPGANIMMHKTGELPQEIRDLWSNERLLNIMEQLLGENIAGHPVWNLRTKTPQCEAVTVPWHQDNAYLDDRAADMMIPTAWIPLLDCDVVHGCLEFLRSGNKTGKLAEHQCCAGGTWYVECQPEDMEKTLEVKMSKRNIQQTPIGFGGMVLFTNVTPHKSLDNFSDKVRWSLDLRWYNPERNPAFYDMLDGVIMRKSGATVHKIDWDTLTNVDRHALAMKDLKEEIKWHMKEGMEEEEFDTTMPGPWMRRWEIVHHNRHTLKYIQSMQ